MRMKLPLKIILAVLIIFSYIDGNRFFSRAEQLKHADLSSRDPFESWLPKPAIEVKDQPVSAGEPAVMTQRPQIQPPALIVTSQISGGPVPQAVIDGKIFRVGDKVQGALITNITREGIKVLYEEQTFLYPAPSRMMKYSQAKGGKNE